jgi:hypothetical protein
VIRTLLAAAVLMLAGCAAGWVLARRDGQLEREDD